MGLNYNGEIATSSILEAARIRDKMATCGTLSE